MPTFLITYHGGGGPPATPEAQEQMMSAFMAWAASVGGDMIDPGAPLGPPKIVSSDGVTDGTRGDGAEGYTVLKADSLDAAVKHAQTHPFVARGGTLRISEAVAP